MYGNGSRVAACPGFQLTGVQILALPLTLYHSLESPFLRYKLEVK